MQWRCGPVRLLRLGCATRCVNAFPDRVPADHQFHAAILLAAFRRIVGCDRLGLPESEGGHGTSRHELINQILAHRLRPLLREPLIEIVASPAVGVTFHLHLQRRISEQDAGNFRKLLARSGLQGVAAGVKEHVGHIYDQSPDSVVRLQNGAELLQELFAQFRFLGFRLCGCEPRFFCLSLGRRMVPPAVSFDNRNARYYVLRKRRPDIRRSNSCAFARWSVANITVPAHFQSRNQLLRAGGALLALISILAVPAHRLAAQGSPSISGVDPASGKPNDVITVSGQGLEKSHVAAVFLSDDKDDHKAVVVTQADDKITIKVPEVKPGDYNISIQSGNAIFIQPVRFTVQ